MDTVLAILITVLFTVFVPLIIFIIFRQEKRTVKRNGVKVVLSKSEYSEYKQQLHAQVIKEKQEIGEAERKKKNYYANKVNELNEKIKDNINSETDSVRKKILYEIHEMPCEDEQDYDYKYFLFNNGALRSDAEVGLYKTNIYNTNHREGYNSERHIVTLLSTVIAFIITFCLLIFALPSDLKELKIFISLYLGVIGALIGSIIGHTINISNAKQYGIPDDHPSVKKEKLARGLDIAGIAISSTSAIHNTKNAAKDVMNVDGWKEFK